MLQIRILKIEKLLARDERCDSATKHNSQFVFVVAAHI